MFSVRVALEWIYNIIIPLIYIFCFALGDHFSGGADINTAHEQNNDKKLLNFKNNFSHIEKVSKGHLLTNRIDTCGTFSIRFFLCKTLTKVGGGIASWWGKKMWGQV